MSLTLAAILVGGYVLALGIVLVFAMSLGRAAKDCDEREARYRRAEAARRRRSPARMPPLDAPDSPRNRPRTPSSGHRSSARGAAG